MNFEQYREWLLFFQRVAVLSFFSIGFIQYYQRVWSDVFETDAGNTTKPRQIGRRIYLMLLSLGLGLGVHLITMAFMHNNTALIYHNLALYVLIVPLMFGGFNRVEVGIQLVAILDVWWMHHATNFWHVPILLALVGFAIILVLVHRERASTVHRSLYMMIASLLVAGLFWLSTPVVSVGMPLDNLMRFEGMALYSLMLCIVVGYWMRQYRQERHSRQLELLASYEQGTNVGQAERQQGELTQLFDEARQQHTPLTFVALDIDHFQRLNDRFGHLAGNTVLIGLTASLSRVLDNAHVDHRLYFTSGEEVNVAFPNHTPDQVMSVIRGCWQVIRKSEYSYADHSLAVTASFGVTSQQPEDTSINDIYKRVDDALSKSKRNGRDMITLDNELISGTSNIEKRLNDYCYFSQGVYDIDREGKPRFYHELLLRTYDELQKRWILPDTFELPAWMQISLLKDFMAQTELQNFNMNLTAAQFVDLELAEALTQFAESDEGPDNLTIEITALTDSQTMRRICAVYRASKIKILIDDVGSDNSFEMVRNIVPYINGVKFAMQNLRQTTSDAELRERVQFWVQIAKDNQLSFVLEGVETEADLAFATQLGVRYVQGYYFGKPRPAGPEQQAS